MSQNAKEILDTMLGFLGFICEIKEFEKDGALTLQIYTPEFERLIGPHDETLEDIQFLLNRILLTRDKNAPRVNIDVEHHREMREDSLVQWARQFAEGVRKSGRSVQLDPLNAYDRRIVHNAFKDDPDVMTWSPQDDLRVKRITLKKRPAQPGPSA